MKLDFFFNVFGREDEWNQIIIFIICLSSVIRIKLKFYFKF